MQKFLRTLTLMALMLVPWVTQGQQTLPYSYGFEDNDLTTDGWLLLNATSSGISSNAAQNGSYGFSFYYGESNDATLVSPVLTGTTNGVTVSFSYKEYDDSYGDEQFYVGYTTDETVTDPSDFTYGSIITASLSWQQYENTFPAGTKRIAIKYVYNDAYYLFLDDFTFEAPSSCAKPSAIDITGATASSISISWTPAGSETSWNVYLNGVQQNTTPVTTTSYTFNGLSLGDDYTIGVTAICGSNESALKTTTHHLGYCSPSPSSVDGSGIISVSFGGMTNTTHPSSAQYADYSSMSGSVPASTTATVEIIYGHQYSYGTIIWVDWNNDFTFSGDEVVYAGQSADGSNPHTLTATFEVPATQAVGNYRMRILGSDSDFDNYTGSLSAAANANPCATGYSWGVAEDYTLTVAEAPSCMPVSDLAYSNLTDAGVTLSWTDPNGGSNTYVVKIGDDVLSATTTPAVTFNGTTATITGLTALTSYTFSVAVDCGSATSPSSNISVTTPCGAETMPWTENFDSWTSKSTCWSFLSGAYNMGNGTPTTYSSAWTLSSSYGSYITLSGKALAMNIYSTYRYWAVTPNINITTNDAVLNVDVAVSAWNAATTNYDADDTLAFAISTDGGATFTHLMALNNTELNALANTYTTISVPVSGYNGQTVRFAIFGGSSAYGGDNRIVIDNVTVDVAPTCYKPTALTYDNVTTNGATLTWTRDTRNADGETYSILDENDQVVTGAANISGTSFQLTGLNENTEYTFKVRTNCANPSENVDVLTVTFTTLANCQAPVLAAAGITNVTAHTADVAWTGHENDSYDVSYRTAAYFDGESEEFSTTSIPTGWTRYTGLVDNVMNGTATLATTTSGWVFSSTYVFGAYHSKINIYGTNARYWLVTPETTVGDGYGLSFDLALSDYGNANPIEVIGNQADDRFVVLITTDNMATWTILREWNNSGSAYVYDNIATAGENVTIDLAAYAGQNVKVAFYGESTVSGGDNDLHIDNVGIGQMVAAGAWQTVNTTATSTNLTGLAGETVYDVKVVAHCGSNVSDESATLQFTTDIACPAPTGLAASNPTTSSVDLTWTENGAATAWQICVNGDETNLTNATTNPFTLTGLAEYTEYTIKVRANCGGIDGVSEWSNTITATTLAGCQAVQNLAYSDLTAEGVTLSWTDPNSGSNTYTVTNVTTSEVLTTNCATTTFDVTGLTAQTLYTFSVAVNCATATSDVATVAVTTPCAAVTIPFTENFDSHTTSTSAATGVQPDCWTLAHKDVSWTAASYNPQIYYGTSNAHSGSYSLRLYYRGIYAMPPVNVNVNQLQLHFWVKQTSAAYQLEVGVMSDLNDASTFVPIETINNTSTSAYEEHTIYFNQYTGNGRYIAFHNITTNTYNYSYNYIDDITVDYLPSCFPVSNLAADVTSSSVTLSWTDASNSGATYTVYDMSDNSVIEANVNATTYTVGNLTANTPYEFGVRANCSATDESDMTTISTRTACGTETIPFTEDFSASLASNPCWSGATGVTAAEVFAGATLPTAAAGQGGWNFSTSQNGYTDGHYYNNIYGTSKKAWLITPAIDLTTTPSAQLSFDMALTAYSGTKAAPAAYTGDQQFMVIVSADGGNTWLESNATVWNQSGEGANYSFTQVPYADYGSFTINLNNYLGNVIKIAFYAQSTVSGGDNDLHIDNIAVTEVPECSPIANLTASDVTATGAVLTWADNDNENATYTVKNGNVVVESGITATTYTLTGLTPNTTYTFAVVANCAVDAEPVEVNVTTLQVPATLPYATGFETGDDMQWTLVNGTNGWYFGEAATDEGNSLYISNDGGVSNAYTTGSSTASYAYRTIDFAEAGYYSFAFDWKAYGESTWDFIRVALVPTNATLPAYNHNYYQSLPEGWIAVDGGYLNKNSEQWNSVKNTIELTTAGQYNLVIAWMNDGSGGSNPPAAVDNIVVKAKSAFEPSNFTAENISATGATLTWTANPLNNGTETYTLYNNNVEVATGITGNNYTATLTTNTDYNFTLVAVNGGDNSDAVALGLGVYEYPTQAGKMVYLGGTILNTVGNTSTMTLYRGLGDNLTEQANYTEGTYLTEALTTYTASNEWPVYGPMTVIYMGETATSANTGVAALTPGYKCPMVVSRDAVEETANGAYTWTTPEGTVYNYENHRDAALALNENGDIVATYYDTVRNAGDCDSIINTLQLTLHPDFVITVNDAEICEGETYTLTNADQSESFSYTATGDYTVLLHSVYGADSVVNLSLQMHPAPVAYINGRAEYTMNDYCDNFELTLTAGSSITGVNYEWEDASTDAVRTVTPHINNVYTLTATDPVTGCSSLTAATLTVNTQDVPVLTVDGDAAICFGQSATLTVTDANAIEGVTFRWRNAATDAVVGVGATLTVSPTETTVYTVTAEGACDVTSEPFTVTVNPLPVAEVATSATVLCAGAELTISATEGFAGYEWSNGATTATSTFAAATTGSYTVTVTDANGCVNEFTTANVTVNPVYELNDAQSVCFTQNPYTWGTQTITENGNYDQTFQTVNGCDSLVHLTFTFEEMSVNNTYREVCQNTDVTWGETTYPGVQESTTLTYIDNSGDCPEQKNLVLTVNPVKASSFEQVVCDSYLWPVSNVTYTESGAYPYTLQTVKGCDSVVTMNLTVNYQNTGIDEQTACDRYEWIDGNIYTESNSTATYTLQNAMGCDSVVTLNLTVNYKNYAEYAHTECDATSYTWLDGETYNIDVEYNENGATYTYPDITNAAGCDSIAVLHLTMNYVLDTLNWVNVTECDNYYLDVVQCDGNIVREYFAESGDVVRRTRNAETGRDRISRIHLTINNSEHQTVPVTACVPYTWNVSSDITIENINPVANDTVISQELVNEFGCNVIKVLRLTVLRPTENVTPVTLCQNGSWTDGNSVEYLASNYQLGVNEPVVWNTTTNVAGCDSVDKVVFTVNPVYNVTAEETYCESEFTDGPIVYANPNNAAETVELTIPGALNQVAYTNTVIANWTTAQGCDSIVTITYTVNPSVTEEVTVQNCYSYTWNGREYNTLGETEDTFETVSALTGCDSIAILHLTLTDTVIGVVTIEACGEYTYNNVTYRESKTFIEESGLALSGCDSVTHFVYNLTPRVMKDVYVVANAPYTWENGQTYTTNKDGIYYDATLPGACDSILVLHLTMEQPIVICENELPYTTTFGVTLTDDTSKYTETINGVLYDIDYTVNHNTVETVTVDNACDSYEWHGVTYTESGNYTFDTLNANGCDSTVTLALTVNVSTDSVLTAVACDSYDWSGIHFTASADTTIVGQTNAKGCDSTATLHLTINVNPGVEETVAICNSYVWNNQTLTVTGDYNQSFNDANGCTADSVLHLTINTPTENNLVIIDTAASTYYNGTYYADINEANGGLPYTFDVLYEGANVNGCDSTDHVTLYVTRGIVTDENYNMCGNFTWTRNNHTYAWIDAAERQANGNALYKDITDATAPVYIHTGENPTAVVTDAMGVPDTTYVLWLNMIEANYFTVDLGDIMLSDVASMNVNPGDSLDTQTLDFSEYITNKQGEPNYSDTIHHTSTYYCENVVTYTANLIYNYDTVAPVTVCDATSWTDPVEGVHSVTTGANEFDYVTADNWHHHIVVTNKARTNSDHQVVTACDTYTWTAGDSATYTTSGSYTWNNNDTAICSLETLDLTINSSNAATDQHVACDTYTWINGTTYTASNNTDTVMRTNVAGCDSTVTLDLTINTNAGTSDTVVACDSYTWTYMADPLTASNTYTVDYNDVNGCAGTHTLYLTINNHVDNEVYDTACVSYTWVANNNAEYTASGDYTRDITDANGCAATETLHLVINTPELFTRDQYVYGNGITIDGQFYAAAATGVAHYTVVLDTVDGNGCATTVTVELYVSQYEYVYTNHVGCGSYTWTVADNGDDKVYRTMTATEAAANPTALYWNETDNAPVLEMPRHSDGNMIYVLNLTLNEPSVTEINVTALASQLGTGNVYSTVDGDIDCSAAVAAKATTVITEEFSMGPHAACDSIVRYNINVVYNYDTLAPVTYCENITTYTDSNNVEHNITVGDNPIDFTVNAGTDNEMNHHVVVTVNAHTPSTPQVVTACDTYTWENGDGQTYTVSGTYNWNDDENCTAETLQLTINNHIDAELNVTVCDTYTWVDNDNAVYTTSGDYTRDITDVNECAATETLHLTINTNAGVEETVAACDSYSWTYAAEPLTESNTYTETFTDGNGCEGTATLHLTINTNAGIKDTVASCYTYTWTYQSFNAVTSQMEDVSYTYTESGDKTETYVDANGCVGTATLNLTINGSESIDTAFWFGDGSYRYTGIFTTAPAHMYTPGDYTGITETVNGVTANGCDSIYNITLHVGNNYTHTDAVRSCATYTWNRNNTTYARLTDAQAAEYPTAIYFDQTNNEPVYYNPVVVEPRVNDYADEYMLDLTLDAIHEEDVVVDLPVFPGTLAYGDSSYNVALADHDMGRVFVDSTFTSDVHFGGVQYCDSIVHLTVNVINNYVDEGVVDLCYTESSYTWEGESIVLDANPDVLNEYYIYHVDAVNNTVKYQKVIQHPIQYVTERRVECDSYEWRGTVYTESTSGVVRNFTDQYGCDSTVTLVLTINHTTSNAMGSEAAPIVACDGYEWILSNNEAVSPKYTESGVYTMDYTSVEGCPSTDTLYLTVNNSTETTVEAEGCGSYTWMNGNETVGTYTASGTYTHTFDGANVAGCDSTVTLTLTIHELPAIVYDAPDDHVCDTFIWTGLTWNGTEMVDIVFDTITETAYDLHDTAYNEFGCPIPHYISAVYIDKSSGRTEVVTCDNYEWHGTEYTESGAYEYVNPTTNACGNPVDSLYLTINKNSGHLEEVAICSSNLPAGGYIWNGNAYTVDGEYYYDYTDDNNCLSQDTLKLTIGNVRSYGRVYVENCGPYTWDVTGETFTESTEASTIMAGANAVGCDSVLMLYLTIYEQPVVNETAVVCNNEPYIWHGQTLETTGEYTVTAPYDEHCDSLYVLNLTVNEITYSTTDVTACDSYEWNGETYTENGVYTYNTTNAAGCDSVATLNLTINANSGHVVSEAVCDSYEWHGVTYTESGEYYYNYSDANNCASEDTLLLTIANSENNTVTETACDSYTWTAGNGETYTESGTYVYNYTTDDNCTGVKTLVLTVNSSNSSEEIFEACDSYDWNGETYTESGVYTYTTTNVAGCDSVVTLNLKLNKSTEGEETLTACNYYTWNGTTYTTSGDYTYNTTNAAGCDSVATLHLTVNSNDAVTINEEACDSYTWNGAIYTQSGDYTYAGTNAAGCDSVVTLHLTIKNGSTNAVQATACNSYVWTEGDGQTYTESGVYTYTTNAANGCDSVVTLTLTINTPINTTEDVEACESYVWNNETYNVSGTYTYDFVDANNCDAVATLNLTINAPANTTETVTACDSYTWNNQTYTNSGVYTNAFVDVNGCNAMATLNLTVNASTSSNEVVTNCGSYEWNGQTYTQTGLYTFDTVNAAGCDSTATLSLVINQNISTTETATACDSYEWNGQTYTESGVYTFNGTANGCDSIATLLLTIKNSTNNAETATACDSYTWNNTEYVQSGDYTYSYTNAAGCASTDTLHLTVNASSHNVETATACSSYEWHGETYVTSGDKYYTYTNVAGCASVDTLHLTINQPVTNTISATACESYTWNGQTYTTSGSYQQTFAAANNCDSVVTLILTVNQPLNTTESAVACGSYTWNGQTYTTSGAKTYNFTDVNNCAAVATLNLTINNPVNHTVTESACETYTWNGLTYTTSGTYTYTTTAANNCDSVVTLNLTINPATTENVYAEACSSYNWNGQTYNQSGVYTYQTTNANGCDSTVTLLLNISQAAATTVNQTACDSYTWTGATGATYTASGEYTYTTTTVNGCDSTITLNLTINNSASTSVNETACDNYSWNGQTYTTSGTYTQTFVGANGCDSTVTLTLTVNTPVNVTITETACSSYEWNGTEYTTSGTYTYTTTAANGCDSVTTLNLTINQPVYVNLDVNAEGSYSWNGTVYTESGVYTYTTNAANGCDSVTTLNLTVTPVYTVTLVSSNSAWGTVSESGSIVENGYFTATATANEGYMFVAWFNGFDTVSTNATYVFQVTEDITLTAVFLPKPVGIEDVDMDNVSIYSTDSRIFVRGAEGYDVYVYDVNGRMMDRQLNAPDAIEFRMTATGVYLVKVGNAPAKRVVVVR